MTSPASSRKMDKTPQQALPHLSSSVSNITLKEALEFPVPVKRKEPKFVPYEPYKAAVTPIVPSLKKVHTPQEKCPKPKPKDRALAETCIPFPLLPLKNSTGTQIVHTAVNKVPPMIRVLREIEIPKSTEDAKEALWEEEKRALEEELEKVKNEKKDIEDQFKVQLKVNAELKKLLVASLGEDLQTRVQFLSEDKAKLAEDILHYSKLLQEEHEEMDRLSIQCDVWRSKFLACSLMVDELAQWKARLSHHFEEACEAIHWLLEEHKELQQQLQVTQRCLKALQNTFDPLSLQKSKKPYKSHNLLQLCKMNRDTAEALGSCLLGAQSWEAFLARNSEAELLSRTPAEEFAHRVYFLKTNSSHAPCPDGSQATESGMPFKPGLSLRYCRLHAHDYSDSLAAINCCRQCSGEVKVL